jgi:uncharacterized protein (TIGR02452 family)
MANTNYSNPWREREQRAERAKTVVKYFRSKHRKDIEDSERRTVHYPARNLATLYNLQNAEGAKLPEIEVVQDESVSAAYKYNGKVAILNFASYKNPGGMFYEGSIAQEESLCHESDLYCILASDRIVDMFYRENRRHLNRALYGDNLLYTPNVTFIHDKELRRMDVITCAAPNKGAAQKYQNVSDKECDTAMRGRIQHILLAAIDEGVEVLILGAFGCGVFKNDPRTVAQIFKEELIGCPFKAVFAVPGEKYYIFKDVFEK